MPRTLSIRMSKTRIRPYFRRMAEFAIEDIDRYRQHVADGRQRRQTHIEKRARSLPEEAQEFLADDLYELDTISELADQLAIVALYRAVEITTGKMLAHEFGPAARGNASNIDQLREYLQTHKTFDLHRVSHFRAVNELRLLNNAIKHSGRVTKPLAQEFPRWKEGRKLENLGPAYKRLSPKVPLYILRLAERMKLKYK